MTAQKVKLQDIEFDLNLVNISKISAASRFSYAYTYKLLTGTKRNPKAILKLRHTVVKLYGSLIKFVPYDLKLETEKAA